VAEWRLAPNYFGAGLSSSRRSSRPGLLRPLAAPGTISILNLCLELAAVVAVIVAARALLW
jgi:hypothetical protein